MDLIISYIGFSQALYTAVMLLTKRPLRIAEFILGVLLIVFALLYGFDILQNYNLVPTNRWFISLSITMLFGPLLFLYSKYITTEYAKFVSFDYIHALPSLILLLIFLILSVLPANTSTSLSDLFVKYQLLRNLFGYIFIILLLMYIVKSIAIVMKFKKQLKHYYSYNSYKINLDWLLIVIISFAVIFFMIVLSSTLFENRTINKEVFLFRHVIELCYVYILGIWGFNQKQLNSIVNNLPIQEEQSPANDKNSPKYQKSGLKDELAKEYLHQVIDFMEKNDAWKDPELSIGKLSNQTSISKHHISETLNGYLGKSFYNFVNEYRVEYAKKLLNTKKYNNWSIVAIAYECGFNSKTAFNIFFKNYTKVTPSEYKKKQSNQTE